MRVFVAGATGVIGRALLPRLLQRDHVVIGMTRHAERARRLRDMGVEPAVCDVYDIDGLQQALRTAKPDVVVHELTALPEAIDPRKIGEQLAENDRIRTEGTRNLVQATLRAGVARMVAQSIAFAYAPAGGPVKREDDPLWIDAPPGLRRTPRAVASLEDQVTSTEGINGTVLRYGYFYGPGSAYAPDGSVADAVRARRFPVGGDGSGMFSFIHVDDAAVATVAAVEQDKPGIYNIVDDCPLPLRDWLPAYAAAIGAPPPRHLPGWLVRVLAGRYGHYMMTRQRGASNERAKRELGFAPQYPSLDAGLASSGAAA
ncbi:MAG: NAD(P)-dependent oxidoreductase [Acidobacteriota bacterium]|jgi:nucleoside-diphosphate-sugar epimerase